MRARAARGGRSASLCAAFAIAACAVLAFIAGPAAGMSFCPKGTAAGQCQAPQGLAVDSSSARVYVADSGNNRIDVFDSAGNFLKAFGWGVADGVTPALQTCTAVCFAGTEGAAGGQMNLVQATIAVDDNPASPSFHDVYVAEPRNRRVQKFGPEGEFLLMFGGGVLTGGAGGTGNLTAGSTTVSSLKATSKAFVRGQTITGAGIQPGTTIAKIVEEGGSALVLSKPAEATASGVALTVSSGPGHIPVNERQAVELKPGDQGPATGGTFTLTFRQLPGRAEGTATGIAYNAAAASVRAKLEALPGIGSGNVAVSGVAGGPWTIEFVGSLADTDIPEMVANPGGLEPAHTNLGAVVKTVTNGASAAEVCSAAEVEHCQRGVEDDGPGAFGSIAGIGVSATGAVGVADSYQLGQCGAYPSTSEYKSKVEVFSDAGVATEELTPSAQPACGAIGSFALAPNGVFYVASSSPEGIGVYKYGASGSLTAMLDSGESASMLSVDPSGDVFAAQREGGYTRIAEWDPTGAVLRRFAYGKFARAVRGLGPFHTAGGDIFASEESGVGSAPQTIQYLAFPPPGPVVPPSSLEASPLGNVRATLDAQLNPEGKSSEYHFEYVDQEGFVEQGGFVGPKTVKTSTASVGSNGDYVLHAVSAQAGCTDPVTEMSKCLIPETVYHFQIVATNADGTGEGTVEGTFETKPPLELNATWTIEVGPDSAALHAELNPFGIPASGVFEYVDDSEFQQHGFATPTTVPAAGSISFGSGEVSTSRGVTLFPLQPGTTYHYRISAIDTLIGQPVRSEPRTFRTFEEGAPAQCAANEALRYGAAALLPDCRAYEMVTPQDKGGADILPGVEFTNGVQAALDQSSLSGSRLTYGSMRPFADAHSAPYISQFIGVRNPETGWQSGSISPPKTTLILPVAKTLDSEFKAFSPDLCEAWLRTVSEPVLAPHGLAGYPNIYRRTDQECAVEGYEAITTSRPPSASTPEGQDEKVKRSSALELQGVSSNGTAAVYVWNDNLPAATPTPAPQPANCSAAGTECAARLYEQIRGGALRYLCVLPSGEASPKPCSAGTQNGTVPGTGREANLQNAISTDGSRVFWSDSSTGPGRIYVRIGGASTAAVSQAAEEAEGSSSAQFYGASEDGSLAVFTTGQGLYEFNVDTKLTTPVAKGVVGVLGLSESATKVYFVSPNAIPGAGTNSEGVEATPGKPNLYLHEAGGAGSFHFIATLTGADVSLEANGTTGPLKLEPYRRSSRVSANGLYAAFISSGSLTGYDSRDAANGKADQEVYLYDASSDELLCASCNPTESRPVGTNIAGEANPQWAAAWIPAWENSLYAPRVLSDDGKRLFFESTDALVARDANGVADLYEWEAPGTGTCTTASYTFSAQDEGCVDLVSTGKSPRAAEFVDASPSGANAFFATQESLVGQDSDPLIDIYDARVEGGFPAPEPAAPECEAEACQHPAPAPQTKTPSSSQYRGPGNLKSAKPSGPGKCPRGKHKVKKSGKTRCVKNKGKGKKHKSGRLGR
jgi:hypothetical protein